MTNTINTLITEEELKDFSAKVPLNKTPLWQYWDAFVEWRAKYGRSQSTAKNTKDSLRMIIRHSNVLCIEDLNNKHLIRTKMLELKKARGWKGVTHDSHLKCLKTYLIWLDEEDYIDEVKIGKTKLHPDEPVHRPTQTADQVRAVLEFLGKNGNTTLERLRNVLFYKIMAFTGARPIELERLKLSSIKMNGSEWNLVVIGAKNKPDIRTYPIPNHIKDSLIVYLDYREKIGRDEDSLFVAQSHKNGWTQKGMRGLMKKISKEFNSPMVMYSLRRFTATTLAEQGMSIDQIAYHLGHTDERTTKKYIKHSAALTRDSSTILGRITNLNSPL